MILDTKDAVYKTVKLQGRQDGVKFFYLPETVNNEEFEFSGGDDLPVGVISKEGVKYAIFPLQKKSKEPEAEAQ